MPENIKNIAIGVAATIFVILAIAGFSTLVGGEEHTEDDGHGHAAESTTAVPPARVSPDDVFLHLVHDNLPETRSIPDSELIEAGHLACDTIEKVGMEFFLAHMAGDADANHFTSVMVAASLVAYCPELTPNDWDEQDIGV